MPEEEIKAEETASVADTETKQETEQVTEPSNENTEPSTDWKAKYDETKERLEKAEYTLYQKNKAKRAERQNQVSQTGVIDPDEIERIVEAKATAMLEAQREKDSEDFLEEELRNLASDADERAYLKLIYENRIQKTGYSRVAIRDDLAEAQVLANAPKILKTSQEKSEIIKAQSAVSKTGFGTNQDRNQVISDDPSKELSTADLTFLKNRYSDSKELEKQIRLTVEKKRSGILTDTLR